MSDAYDIAKAGGKHGALLPQLEKMGDRQIGKLMQSFGEEIALHRAKVQNPSSVIADWESLDRRYRDGLIAHWKKEIEVFESEVAISERVLYERKQ